MSVLDELRAATKKRARLTNAIDELFDAFEAAHPGLVDLTATCTRCGYIGVWALACPNSEDGWRIEPGWRGVGGWEDHCYCPACAKEATE